MTLRPMNETVERAKSSASSAERVEHAGRRRRWSVPMTCSHGSRSQRAAAATSWRTIRRSRT